MKYLALAAPLAALAVAQGVNDAPSVKTLPACGQYCVTSMLSKYEQLKCKSETDLGCICQNADFQYGIRDCTNESCAQQDRGIIFNLANQLCAGQNGGSAGSSSGADGASSTGSGAGASGTGTSGSGGAGGAGASSTGSGGNGTASATGTGGTGGNSTTTGAGGASSTGGAGGAGGSSTAGGSGGSPSSSSSGGLAMPAATAHAGAVLAGLAALALL